MKIGIIGCGYVGKAAAAHLIEHHHEVYAATRKTERIGELQKITPHVILLDSLSFRALLEKVDALLISVAPDPGTSYRSTYLEVVEKVTEEALFFPHLQQIIYTGSTSVYGDHHGEWVDEESVLRPMNENGLILCETEQKLLQAAHEHLKVCILRLGEIYGPGREIEKRLIERQNRPFPGTGNNYTNLSELSEITNGITFAVKSQLNGIYNLCNDIHLPRKEFYSLICKDYGITPVKWDPTLPSPHGGNRRVSNRKMKQAMIDC